MPFLIHSKLKTHYIACRIWKKNRGGNTPNPDNREGRVGDPLPNSPPRRISGAAHLRSSDVGALRRWLSRFPLSEIWSPYAASDSQRHECFVELRLPLFFAWRNLRPLRIGIKAPWPSRPVVMTFKRDSFASKAATRNDNQPVSRSSGLWGGSRLGSCATNLGIFVRDMLMSERWNLKFDPFTPQKRNKLGL